MPLADATTSAHHKNLIWILVRRHDIANQNTSAWTGFNIKTRDHMVISADKIGYLSTINAPPAELSTVHEVLCRSVSIQQHLQLEKIAVIMDQASQL